MRPLTRSRRVLPLALLALGAAAGCKGDGDPMEPEAPREASAAVSQELTARATVKAVDRETRAVTLKDEDGAELVVVAGPQVINFDQIEVGDALVVRYLESIAVQLDAPGTAPSMGSTVGVGAAEPGQKPAGAIGQAVDMTVRIESVDVERNIVVFTGPEGGLRTVRVVRPEGREFLKKIRPGDQVRVTFTEALALSIEQP